MDCDPSGDMSLKSTFFIVKLYLRYCPLFLLVGSQGFAPGTSGDITRILPFFAPLKIQSIYEKGFMKPKSMRILCRQRTLLQIVLVLRKSANVTENAKNASSITTRKARSPIVQDNRLNNHLFSVLLSVAIATAQVKSPTSHARAGK